MIPTIDQAKVLWDKYHLPERKRRHCLLVAQVARFLAEKLNQLNQFDQLNQSLLTAAALLHDIDKNVQKLPGEQHPDAAVRILKEEGMPEVVNLVKTHPLHAILDLTISPKTWEEKILYLSDKMVKYEILTVEERFALWRREDLPEEAADLLDTSYPKVKQLEKEIFSLIDLKPGEVGRIIKSGKIAKLA